MAKNTFYKKVWQKILFTKKYGKKCGKYEAKNYKKITKKLQKNYKKL